MRLTASRSWACAAARTKHTWAAVRGSTCCPMALGDLPGSQSGLSHFVVVDPAEPMLEVEVTAAPRGSAGPHRPAAASLQARIPDHWTRAEGWVTVWMPGFLIQERRLPVTNGRMTYTFDAATWRHDFPNIDPQPVDTFVVTLSASGVDRDGKHHTRARLLVIQGRQVW